MLEGVTVINMGWLQFILNLGKQTCTSEQGRLKTCTLTSLALHSSVLLIVWKLVSFRAQQGWETRTLQQDDDDTQTYVVLLVKANATFSCWSFLNYLNVYVHSICKDTVCCHFKLICEAVAIVHVRQNCICMS